VFSESISEGRWLSVGTVVEHSGKSERPEVIRIKRDHALNDKLGSEYSAHMGSEGDFIFIILDELLVRGVEVSLVTVDDERR
jgi:hypothetical protein